MKEMRKDLPTPTTTTTAAVFFLSLFFLFLESTCCHRWELSFPPPSTGAARERACFIDEHVQRLLVERCALEKQLRSRAKHSCRSQRPGRPLKNDDDANGGET